MRHSPSEWNGLPAQPAHQDMPLAVGVLCVSAASVVLLWRHNTLLLLATLVEAAAALRLWHERYDQMFFAVLAILGTCAEIVFVRAGIWRYANPTLAGIPIWFPLAFSTHGLACERLVDSLARRGGPVTGARPPDQ